MVNASNVLSTSSFASYVIISSLAGHVAAIPPMATSAARTTNLIRLEATSSLADSSHLSAEVTQQNPNESTHQLTTAVVDFFDSIADEQQDLGFEFSTVLHANAWDLFEEA